MNSLTGIFGIFALLGIAWLLSSNRQAINWRLIISGLALQIFLAVFCLKIPLGREIFHILGHGIERLLQFSNAGAGFVFGFLVNKPGQLDSLFGPGSSFIFAFKLVPTIIFVAALVSIAYHLGLIQRLVRVVAWLVYKLMGASGSEALSNAASIFVGQIEAQLLIRPYLATMTSSELLAVMSGSMACIAGGVMAVYIQMGIPAEFLLTASVMSVPGALVMAKLVLPETQPSLTRGSVSLEIRKESVNLIDAAARGASEGLKIGLNVCAMLIGFLALIGLIDFLIGKLGLLLAQAGFSLASVDLNLHHLSLNGILGSLFSVVAFALGVPAKESAFVGSLMGAKMVTNEFVAYSLLAPKIATHALSPRALAIASVALCGFANFSSIAMQIGGIGEMAPSRKQDLARLGMKALLCGTMASYVSAALAGLLVQMNGSANEPLLLGGIMLTAALLVVVARWLPDGSQFYASQSANIPLPLPLLDLDPPPLSPLPRRRSRTSALKPVPSLTRPSSQPTPTFPPASPSQQTPDVTLLPSGLPLVKGRSSTSRLKRIKTSSDEESPPPGTRR
jgi:CNT family concentrative nucleoside transporter